MAKGSAHYKLVKLALGNMNLATRLCNEALEDKDMRGRIHTLWIAEGDVLDAAAQLRDAVKALKRPMKKEDKNGRGKKVSHV